MNNNQAEQQRVDQLITKLANYDKFECVTQKNKLNSQQDKHYRKKIDDIIVQLNKIVKSVKHTMLEVKKDSNFLILNDLTNKDLSYPEYNDWIIQKTKGEQWLVKDITSIPELIIILTDFTEEIKQKKFEYINAVLAYSQNPDDCFVLLEQKIRDYVGTLKNLNENLKKLLKIKLTRVKAIRAPSAKKATDKPEVSCFYSYKYIFSIIIGCIILLAGLTLDIGIPCGMNKSFKYKNDLNPANFNHSNNATWMTIGYMLSFVGFLILFITAKLYFKKDSPAEPAVMNENKNYNI